MRHSLPVLFCLAFICGCGQPASDRPAAIEPAPNASSGPVITSAASKKIAAKVEAPASEPAPKAVADEPIREPATVEQAAAAIDLSTLPLAPGVKALEERRVASLGYQAPGDIKTVFEFQRKALIDRGCKELSDAQIYDQAASGSFGKDGFFISVSVFTGGEAGQVAVRLQNHGNVNLAKLPVPNGVKLSHSFPAITGFITEAPQAETAEKIRNLLLEQGWQPYGTAGDSMNFKKNAVQLSARVHAHQAQPGKTFIDFTAEQMSADLPAPPDAEQISYADDNKRLDVEAVGTPDDVVAFYKQALAPAGWQSTTDNRITDRTTSFMIFRNQAKDMLTLNMRDLGGNKTRYDLNHQTAAEVEEVDRRVKLAIEAKKRKAEEEANRPKPKQAISLPADARDIEASAQEIEFQVASGKGQAALDALLKQLQTSGWKAEKPVGQKEAGVITLNKDDLQMTIQYVDPGFIPAQITISARGRLELERTSQQ